MGVKILVIILLLTAIALFGFGAPLNASVTFLDVGQGDAILFQDGARQVLIDGGAGELVLSRLAQEMPWYDRKVDVLISTHPDKDHLGGLEQVLKRYAVGLVVLPEIAHTSHLQEEWLVNLMDAHEVMGTSYVFARPGQEISFGAIDMRLLGPLQETLASTKNSRGTNDASVAVRAVVHDTSFLLTGDAEVDAERELVNRYGNELSSDVLKLGHHGSKTSTSEEFFSTVRPALGIISVGAHNSYGHPSQVVLDRVANIVNMRTDEVGSIRFTWPDLRVHLSCSVKSCIDSKSLTL